MPTVAPRKTELSPLEAIVVESALGEEARRGGSTGALARIQHYTRERQRLYAAASAHPLLASTYGPRIRALSAEIERLWEVLRRERASRRVQMERALNIVQEEETPEADGEHDGSSDAA